MRASKLLTAAGVMAAGVCAAWPFRQPVGKLQLPPPATIPLDLTLRALDVPLTTATASNQSPAVGLPANERTVAAASSLSSNLLLDRMAPPPEMPVSFRSQLESTNSPLTPLADANPGSGERSSRPRTYVLRDGDTLEKLAERFLGSRERATELYEANRLQLSRPDLLPVGTAITIPPRASAGKTPELAER